MGQNDIQIGRKYLNKQKRRKMGYFYAIDSPFRMNTQKTVTEKFIEWQWWAPVGGIDANLKSPWQFNYVFILEAKNIPKTKKKMQKNIAEDWSCHCQWAKPENNFTSSKTCNRLYFNHRFESICLEENIMCILNWTI